MSEMEVLNLCVMFHTAIFLASRDVHQKAYFRRVDLVSLGVRKLVDAFVCVCVCVSVNGSQAA